MHRPFAPLSLALAAIAAPAAAQDSARDFTLPAGSVDADARPQGPVDDTGVIPVGPRLIRPQAPQAAPSAPAPAAEPAQSPPQPRPQTGATTQQTGASRPGPAPAGQPVEQRTLTESASQLVLPTPGTPAADLSTPLPASTGAPQPDTKEVIDGSDPLAMPLPLWVLWLACGLGLGAIALGALAWRRRAGRSAVPEIEPPIAHSAAANSRVMEAPRFITSVEVQGFTRSLMMVTLEFAVNITNRSDAAMREVRISADLVSASRHLPMEQQVATETAILGEVAQLERIGPNQSRSAIGTLQLPVNAIAPIFQSNTPLFMPLLRLRVECTGSQPHLKTYAIGIGSATTVGKVSPIPLNSAPGGVQGVMARALD